LACLTLLAALISTGCGGGGGGGFVSSDPVLVTAEDSSVDEGDSGQSGLVFTLTLSDSLNEPVTVDYSTRADTAIEGSDYVGTSGTITFDAGVTSRAVTVQVIGDIDEEGNEVFELVLSNVTGGAELDSDVTATGFIVDDDVEIISGLASRPANATCIAPERPVSGTGVDSVNAFSASPGFSSVTKILQAPGDASRWFVLEKNGVIKVFDVANPASPRDYINFQNDLATTVASGGEQGLLGMAFHPNFPAVREVYVSYSSETGGLHSRISRLILDDTDDPVVITQEILLTVDQVDTNHNGGDIAFGNDGYLYIGFGDGGRARDPFEVGQDTRNFLGAMLRIDVLAVAYPVPGYNIPPDNPFSAEAKCGPTRSNTNSCPEIYAWGFRNPWRWSFDEPTGNLWLGDVGEGRFEEVDLVERAGNYGWDCREGANDVTFESADCTGITLIDPVYDYPHSEGNVSITGGYVYRGSAMQALIGRYVFADFASGRIWALQDNGQGGFNAELLIDTPWLISAFALGEDGELYFADYSNGLIRRLVPAGGGSNDTIPEDLVDTGCVDTDDPTQPASGLVPYTINAPFWSDNAVKDRWIALPDSTSISIDGDDDFVFPNGSVIVKNFELNNQLIETRLLMRHPDGVWAGYTYEWNDAETAATRVQGGKTRAVGGQQWIYPSEGECLSCHTSAAGFSLGPETAQFNGDFTYPSTSITANQLETFDHIMMFTNPLPSSVNVLPKLADPADTGASLDDRARAYLHTNCAQCHQPGGPTPSTIDLRYDTALADTDACDVPPASGSLGIGVNARLIAPGSAANSVIPARMDTRDANAMPPLGSNEIDTAGVALINAWIDNLTNCN